MKSQNKAKTIRDYIANNPNATPKEIASACGAKLQYVYQVQYELRSNRKQKRSYVKTKIQKITEPKIVKVNRPTKEQKFSNEDVAKLIDAMAGMAEKIDSLEHDAIGYRAVIDFLEFQLGLSRNNNGATV